MSKICQKKSKTKRKRSPATDHVAHADFGFSSGLITSHAIQVEGGKEEGSAWGTGTEERKTCYQAMMN